jgi:hypothetical protein
VYFSRRTRGSHIQLPLWPAENPTQQTLTHIGAETKVNREAYRPGQLAPNSGIYEVVHRRHRKAHEVTAIRGEEFPACRVCQGEVRYCPTHIASHMTHDLDLAGLLSLGIHNGRARMTGKRTG